MRFKKNIKKRILHPGIEEEMGRVMRLRVNGKAHEDLIMNQVNKKRRLARIGAVEKTKTVKILGSFTFCNEKPPLYMKFDGRFYGEKY